MKKAFIKTGIREIIHSVTEDGEILGSEVRRHTYLANTKEEFFMGYSSLIGAFMEMSQAEIRIFGYILRFAKGVKFDLSKKMRIDIAATAGINERTVLNTIPSLEEKGIIFKHESGLFQINPRFAFAGPTSERNAELKTIIELGCRDC